MRNTPFEKYLGPRLPRDVQLNRLRAVIEQELTPCQREILEDYYYRNMKLPQIARDRGINISTASRTLRRAEKNLQRFLKY